MVAHLSLNGTALAVLLAHEAVNVPDSLVSRVAGTLVTSGRPCRALRFGEIGALPTACALYLMWGGVGLTLGALFGLRPVAWPASWGNLLASCSWPG